jgi:glucosamine-6-phosphate deaminase
MKAHLFTPAGIPIERTAFLDGAAPDLERECARYEEAIAAAGGLDLLLLGVGRNGHVGFNEPAEGLHARSHVATLHAETRDANAEAFGGDPRAVPPRALSMGMATILGARAIVLLATGDEKAAAVQRALEGPVTTSVPASFLQLHPAVTWMLDEGAAGRLGPGARLAAGVRQPG